MSEFLHTVLIPTAHAAVSLPSFKDNTIGGFFGSIYVFAISIVGFAVFIQFIWGGFLYFFAAAGNAAKTEVAKEKMKNAVIGAVLLLSAYLILYVINPDLVRTDKLDQTLKKDIQTSP